MDWPMDMAGDGESGRWLTFAELATARNISKASAQKLVRRRRWRRQTTNTGEVRALVPLAELVAPDSPLDGPSASPPDTPSDAVTTLSRAVGALEAALSALGERAASEAGALRGQIAAERSRAEAAQARAAAAELRADAAEAKLAGHETKAAMLEAAAEQIIRPRGLWARLLRRPN